MSKFKVGDRVVLEGEHTLSRFKIGTVVSPSRYCDLYSATLPSVYTNPDVWTIVEYPGQDVRIWSTSHLVTEELWNSPLMKALREE